MNKQRNINKQLKLLTFVDMSAAANRQTNAYTNKSN